VKTQEVTTLVSPETYVLPAAKAQSGGGGGGGDRDKFQASKGALPRASQEQITPPMVVVRNQGAKLTVEPTVVAPPNITFPQNGQLGNPLAAAMLPSNGTGRGGGIGSGSSGGVGAGSGPGVGPGYGGGIGGGIFRVGGGVSAPRAIYDPEPEYSEEARKAKFQGAVVLSAVIGADGRPRDIRVARSLGLGLDEQAIAAVQNWKFEPAMKDGQPVAVLVNIEVEFRLY
jgi:TonB family protein